MVEYMEDFERIFLDHGKSHSRRCPARNSIELYAWRTAFSSRFASMKNLHAQFMYSKPQ